MKSEEQKTGAPNHVARALRLLACVSSFFILHSAFADLTAVVTPGYQFPLDGSVAPSYNLLNLLGTPTIGIYGTIGGSNTLAAGSVTGIQLNNNVADNITIQFNGNNPPGLQVKAGGISGAGLTNIGTTNLTLWVDTNLFVMVTNSPVNTNSWFQTPALTLKTNALPGSLLGTNAGVLPAQLQVWSGYLFSGGPLTQSTNGITITNGFMTYLANGETITNYTHIYTRTNADSSVTTITQSVPALVTSPFVSGLSNAYTTNFFMAVPHGLGLVPTRYRAVLVNQTAEAGYTPGAEVDAAAFSYAATQLGPVMGADSTNVYFARVSATWSTLSIAVPSVVTSLTTANNALSNWKLKIYVWP